MVKYFELTEMDCSRLGVAMNSSKLNDDFSEKSITFEP